MEKASSIAERIKSTGHNSDSDDENGVERGSRGNKKVAAPEQRVKVTRSDDGSARPSSSHVRVGDGLFLEATVIESPQEEALPRSLLGFDMNNPSPASRELRASVQDVTAGASNVTASGGLEIVSRPSSLVDELSSSLGRPSRPESDQSEYFSADQSTPAGGGSRVPSRDSALASPRQGPRGGKVVQTAKTLDEISKPFPRKTEAERDGLEGLGSDREGGGDVQHRKCAPNRLEEKMFAVSGKHLTGSLRARKALEELGKQVEQPGDHEVPSPRADNQGKCGMSASRIEHGLLQVYGGWNDLASWSDHEVAAMI